MKVKPIVALLFFVAVVICYRVFGYTGHFGFDDMQYAEIAANMLNGDVDMDDHFTFRFTIIVATMLSYRLFGINDFASSLPAMVFTILMLVAVYAMLRKQGFWPTAIGLAMVTTSQWILIYSNKLMPDIYLAFFTTLAVYLYYRYKYEVQKRSVFYAVAFAVTLLCGFMTKGTVVLLLPWLLYLFLADCLSKKNIKFWIWAIVAGGVCLVVYFVSIKVMTGEVLYRFKAIAQNSYLNKCSYDQQPLGVLLRRLYFDFFDMTITNGMSVPIVFVVAAFISKRWHGMLKMQDAFAYFTVSAMLLFLSSNFMTISATSYVPMCIDPRHYLFFVPIAAVAAALFIKERPTRLQVFTIAALFVFLSVYSFFVSRNVCYRIYLPITVVVLVVAALQGKRMPWNVTAAAMLVAMMVLPVALMAEPSYEYNERRDALIDKVVKNKETSLVVSDAVCTRMMRYYNGFSSNERYVDFRSVDKETLDGYNAELVLNYHTLALCSMTYDDLPDYAYAVWSNETPEFDGYGVKLYSLDGRSLALSHYYDTLFCSVNNFDGSTPRFWNGGYKLTQETSYSVAQSNEVGDYSATFSYPLDSLRMAGRSTIFVKISAMCNCYAKSNCAIVVSVEQGGDNISWNSSEIAGRVRAYSHWYQFDYMQEIHLNELPSGAVANVYFYKTDSPKVFVDDFSVSFIGASSCR